MKKILIVILLLVFIAGVYVNFGTEQRIDQTALIDSDDAASQENQTADDEPAEETEDAQVENGESSKEESANDGESLTLNQPALNDRYETVTADNEPLVIDILLPAYYNDDFTERLNDEFNTDTIQFNRQDLEVNTTELDDVTISDNSDAVIIDALQVADYNDELLFDRNIGSLTGAYMDVYNDERVSYILGNPNVHEHENLVNVLAEDEEYFSENDYYYIDNQEISVDGDYDYDNNVMSTAVEDRIISNIYDYLVE